MNHGGGALTLGMQLRVDGGAACRASGRVERLRPRAREALSKRSRTGESCVTRACPESRLATCCPCTFSRARSQSLEAAPAAAAPPGLGRGAADAD
eukprot:3206030-Pleurochrysis_carterae.AAC.1